MQPRSIWIVTLTVLVGLAGYAVAAVLQAEADALLLELVIYARVMALALFTVLAAYAANRLLQDKD